MSNVAINVKRLRIAKGWTQVELGRRAGVTQGTIGHIEAGRNASSIKLPQIAAALGTSVEALISSEMPVPEGHPQLAVESPEQLGLVGARDSMKIRMAPAKLDDGHAQDPAMWRDVDLLLPRDNAFLWRVPDNRMAPRFQQGEFALVEPGPDADIEDDVLVVLKTGEAALWRLTSKRGGIRLGTYASHEMRTYELSEIAYLLYVSHPVPVRRVVTDE